MSSSQVLLVGIVLIGLAFCGPEWSRFRPHGEQQTRFVGHASEASQFGRVRNAIETL